MVRSVKKIHKAQMAELKEMREKCDNLKAFELEAKTLTCMQSDIEMISNKDFAELRRLMNPAVALKDLFTGIAVLFKVPK
jgi:hypothetical protein